MTEPASTQPLPRGGSLIATSAGSLQFGAVPETIKDTMGLPGGVPEVYLLPRSLFDSAVGISTADLEFPIFFQFYARGQRKVRVVGRPDQVKAMTAVLREAVIGPARLDLAPEYPGGADDPELPDMRAEVDHWRTHPVTGGKTVLSDFVEFVPFDEAGEAWPWPGVRVQDLGDEGFAVWDGGERVAQLPCDAQLPAQSEAPHGRGHGFVPPRFGITMVGAGHGFDPALTTSGLIVWIEGRGILVDPPVHTTAWLKRYEISPKQIDSLILTHCHSDHDAGTLQKVLEEGRIKLFTTPTVMASFCRKFGALMGLAPKEVQGLFDYVPVGIRETVDINGAAFTFDYTLHSIPTIRFEVTHAGKRFVYSSDAFNDPAVIDRLVDRKVLSPRRGRALSDFPWDADLILHEAGGPPLHTDPKYLATLPEDVRARMYVNHASPKNVPENLRLIGTGLEHTVVVVPAERTVPAELVGLLERGASRSVGRMMGDRPAKAWPLLEEGGVLGSLTASQRLELAALLEVAHHASNDVLYAPGPRAESCFLVADGQVGVFDGPRQVAVLGRGDLAGALPGGRLRHTYRALTPVEGFRIDAAAFAAYLQGNPGVFLRLSRGPGARRREPAAR